MKSSPSQVSSLVAARVRVARRGPKGESAQAGQGFLRLHVGGEESSESQVRPNGVAPDEIDSLLSRLAQVVRAAQANEPGAAPALQLIQDCIDSTVDAVDGLLAGGSLDASRLAGELRAEGFYSLKSGGCNDLARNKLERVGRTIEKAQSLFRVSPSSPEIGRVAAENLTASAAASHDAEFVSQLSALTPADILAATNNQYSSQSRKKTSGGTGNSLCRQNPVVQ